MTLLDDVLATRPLGPGVIVHRPSDVDSMEPAHPVVNNTGPWCRHGAYRVLLDGGELCHDPACFPMSWSTP